MTIHRCLDDNPMGRPAVVRETVLVKLRQLRRATVARLVEETGLRVSSVRVAMRRAYELGEVDRETRIADNGPYYIYEIAQ